ncbi:hypothetical protein BvCmsA119A_03956 [Escherichia coli]|nr:hypothetical protein BvCmsA119A_03956 [Escherichia coli]
MRYAYQAYNVCCNLLISLDLVGRIRRFELNPKTWTVSVNRLFDTQSGILPG